MVTFEGTLAAMAYIATKKDPKRRPYDWYKAIVVQGATENVLPAAYIELIKSCSFKTRSQYFPSREERGFICGNL